MQYTQKLFRKFIVLHEQAFSTVFSMILKLVKKSLGIECELIKFHLQSKLFLKQDINTGFKELSIQTAYQDSKSWRGYRLIAYESKKAFKLFLIRASIRAKVKVRPGQPQ